MLLSRSHSYARGETKCACMHGQKLKMLGRGFGPSNEKKKPYLSKISADISQPLFRSYTVAIYNNLLLVFFAR